MHVSWIVLILVNIRINTYRYHLKANTMLQPPNWPSLWGETECLRPRWRFGEALHWASKLQWLTDTQREAYRPCYLLGVDFWKETPIIQQNLGEGEISSFATTYGPPRHPVIYTSWGERCLTNGMFFGGSKWHRTSGGGPGNPLRCF